VSARWSELSLDCECAETWQLIDAIRTKMGHGLQNERELLEEWPEGSIHRLVRVIHWLLTATALFEDHIERQSQKLHEMKDLLVQENSRRWQLRNKQQRSREIWITPFTSARIEQLNLAELSQDTDIKRAFPREIAETAGYPVVCWKYADPAGREISNERKVMLKAEKLAKHKCRCHLMPAHFKKDGQGHVVTSDLSIIQHAPTRQLLEKGTTFRDKYAELKAETEMEAIDSGLDQYVQRSSEINNIPQCLFDEWRRAMKAKIKAAYEQLEVTAEAATAQSDEIQEQLEEIKSKYAIISADKASSTFVLYCKSYLCQQVQHEIQQDSTYIEADQTEEQIIENDRKFVMDKEDLATPAPEKEADRDDHTFLEQLPVFGVTVKLHKKNKLRFLAKSHRSSLKQLATWITRALKAMSPVSEAMWRDMFMSAGIVSTGSWVINSSKQCRKRMDKMQQTKLSPTDHQQTYDFSTMYTQLELDSLKKQMREYAQLVFEYAKINYGSGNEMVLQVRSSSGPKWLRADVNHKDTVGSKVITQARLDRWISYLLDNLHVKLGDKIYRQIKGVPMGTSCSPFLANLLLFMYEFRFVRRAVTTWDAAPGTRGHELLTQLSLCSRYIDDLWNPLIRARQFQDFATKIYPRWLKLGEPEHQGSTVPYLDMNITHDSSGWRSSLFDKRVTLQQQGLKINKFPHPDSKLSSRCKYGVITSQLHRFNTACSRPKAFIKAAMGLHTAFMQKGYNKHTINRYFNRFRCRHTPHIRPNVFEHGYNQLQDRHSA